MQFLDLETAGDRPARRNPGTPSTQARYWLFTVAASHNGVDWSPTPDLINDSITYVKGQKEEGSGETNYVHWQFIVYTKRKIRLNSLKLFFPAWSHLEVSRSEAVESYVWKEDTRIEGSQFEYGSKPRSPKTANDWEEIRRLAQRGDLDNIPADVYVRHFSSLNGIRVANQDPDDRPSIKVKTYWGVTGSGKTYRAFTEARQAEGGFYRKASTTKWWDGYKGQKNILIDEFDGKSIGITHLLQWFDPYPMQVECKGSALALAGINFWITSNVDPLDWFPDATPEHRAALRRRLTEGVSGVEHFAARWEAIVNLENVLI
nr:MAG: replication associated protein [Cressdnaviricota sp.]